MLFDNAPAVNASTHLSSSQSEGVLTAAAKLIDTGIIVSLLVIFTLMRTDTWPPQYTIAALLATIVFQTVAGLIALYRPWRGESVTRQFFRILLVWGSTGFVLLTAAYLFKETSSFSRVALTTWFAVTPFALSGWRLAARYVLAHKLKRDALRRHALVVGSGSVADQLADKIRRSAELGLHLADHVETAGSGASPRHDSTAPSDNHGAAAPFDLVETVELRARRGDFSILYIVLGDTSKEVATELVDRLSDTTVSIYVVPDFFTTHLSHGRWSSLDGIPLISVFDTPFWGADGWLKKAQDLVLSTIILAAVSIPMLLIAAAVKLTSPGPVFFRQRRYGIDGKPITVLKFRTMTVTEDGDHIPQARKNDSRITPIGRFLRKHSLDELPQFINVLTGEMSIVGPRPHAIAHNEFYRSKVKGYMLRHKVKPGITGWAQINGWRGETDDLFKMEKRVEHDLWYIRNWSLWLDLKIVMMTIVRGFVGPNAY
jgi:putative colanic acid biosynthesis UDP-glucose lipid carrier transferase